jgi:uncharacterized protein with GYD domain
MHGGMAYVSKIAVMQLFRSSWSLGEYDFVAENNNTDNAILKRNIACLN